MFAKLPASTAQSEYGIVTTRTALILPLDHDGHCGHVHRPSKPYPAFQLSNLVTQNVTETESNSTGPVEVGFIHSAHHLEMSWAEHVPARFVRRSPDAQDPGMLPCWRQGLYGGA